MLWEICLRILFEVFPNEVKSSGNLVISLAIVFEVIYMVLT